MNPHKLASQTEEGIELTVGKPTRHYYSYVNEQWVLSRDPHTHFQEYIIPKPDHDLEVKEGRLQKRQQTSTTKTAQPLSDKT